MIYTNKQKDQRKKSIYYLWLRVGQETKISEQNFNMKSKYHIPTATISFFSLSKKEIFKSNLNLKQNDQKPKNEYSKQNQSNTLKNKKLIQVSINTAVSVVHSKTVRFITSPNADGNAISIDLSYAKL